MKKTTYDAVSTIAVVFLVLFTVAAQRSSRGGYVFGVLAILTAAALFVAYIKATRSDADDQASGAAEEVHQEELAIQEELDAQREILARQEALVRNAREDFYRKLLLTRKHSAAATLFQARLSERLSERQLLLFYNAIERGTIETRTESYYTHVKFQRDSVHDPASIIANIVEKLCASSREPRFEFILEPDGRFKIQQVSAKREASIEASAPHSEPADPSVETEKPELVN